MYEHDVPDLTKASHVHGDELREGEITRYAHANNDACWVASQDILRQHRGGEANMLSRHNAETR